MIFEQYRIGIIVTSINFRFTNLKWVLQGYGMTEASGKISEEFEEFNKQGSVGKVQSGLILKVSKSLNTNFYVVSFIFNFL